MVDMMGKAAVLLVGGNGRVGRLLRTHWPDTSLLVSQRQAAPGAVIWSAADAPAALAQRLTTPPAAMIVLAGVTPAPGLAPDALDANRAIAVAAMKSAQAAGIPRVFLASSSAVYGLDPQGQPFAETAAPAPLSAYGRAKLQMEEAAAPFRAAGLQVTALRIGNVAGADALLFPLTAPLLSGKSKAPIRIDTFADGHGPLRSYIGAQTLARVLAQLAHLPGPLPPILNLATPAPVRMEALARAADWPFHRVPAPATAHQSITLDCRRLADLCPMEEKDSDPATMVAQWKAALLQ